jgi:glycosyltransferase involved in cell wall biosynthesis
MICTYNAPELIKRCLDSVIKQKYSGKKEILIVEGGSVKETLGIIKDYCKKYDYIKIINNKKRLPEGYGYGKWLGWKKCKGEFVFIVDQDNELQGENCLNEMLKPIKKEYLF